MTKADKTCRRMVARPMSFAQGDDSIREVMVYGYLCGLPSLPSHPEHCAEHVPLHRMTRP